MSIASLKDYDLTSNLLFRFFSLKVITNKRSCDIQPVVIKKKDIFKVFIVEHVSFKSIFILVAFSEKYIFIESN